MNVKHVTSPPQQDIGIPNPAGSGLDFPVLLMLFFLIPLIYPEVKK